MKKELSADRLREVLDYDPETGVWVWLQMLSDRAPAGTRAGSLKPSGYWAIGIDGDRYLAHRLAFLYMTDAWPVDQVDHINGDRSDCRWENLRECVPAENQQNCKPRPNASGTTGVGWHKLRNKWRATITVRGVQVHAGLFESKDEAARVREILKSELHLFQPVQRGETPCSI